MSAKQTIALDIVFYLVLPLSIWKLGRATIGDYPAMLLSTIPSTLYILLGLLIRKRLNVTGVFILVILFVRRAMDILAGSSEGFLWNIVYFNTAMVVFWAATMVARRPMALYFFSDYAAYQGYPRKESIEFFKRRELFPYFFLLTTLFLLRDLKDVIATTILIDRYGVDGYTAILAVLSTSNVAAWAIIAGTIAIITRRIYKYLGS